MFVVIPERYSKHCQLVQQTWPDKAMLAEQWSENASYTCVVRRTYLMFAERLWQAEVMSAPNMRRLGLYVRERREQIGFSQEDLAKHGGPSTTTVSKIENAESKQIRERTAQDLEHALGWRSGSVDDILYADGSPRVAKTPVADIPTDLPTFEDPAPLLGIAEEGATVRLEDDDHGGKVFIGRSFWVDDEGRPWRYEVRFWPAPDVAAYSTDFGSVLGDTGRSIRENMTIHRGSPPEEVAPSLLEVSDLDGVAAKRTSEREGPKGLMPDGLDST